MISEVTRRPAPAGELYDRIGATYSGQRRALLQLDEINAGARLLIAG